MRPQAVADPEPEELTGLNRLKTGGRRLGLWAVVVFAAVAAILGVIAWKKAGTSSSVRYETQAVTRGDLVVTVTATGNIEPVNKVDVGTEVSGTIASVLVNYNDQVKVGQLLANLDTTKLKAIAVQSRARLEAARASVNQARANVLEARQQLARLKQVRELSGNTVPSQRDLDAAEAALQRGLAEEASAQAQVAEAQAALEANETDLSKAVIRSPVNGMVLVRNVEPGQTVAASFQAPVLFTLAEDLTRMDLHVDVDEADVGQLREGQEATFTVDAYPDRIFPARVSQIRYGSQIVEGVVTYETLLAVDNRDLLLRPGMTATADIVVKKVEQAILAPNAAFRFAPPEKEEPSKKQTQENRGSVLQKLFPRPPQPPKSRQEQGSRGRAAQHVWTLREGEPQPVQVSVGSTDGRMTEITGGDIEPGMELVVGMTGPDG